MTKNTLAILGGPKTINYQFKKYNSIGNEELEAAKNVVESGKLSKFVGSWEPEFYGGPKIQEFEELCQSTFKVKYAVSVNSWTSGLIAEVGAIGIEPGDEIIVPTWTMSATATAILHWNAIPVFADIDPLTFNIDPQSIEKNISPYTKAIMVVDIFGQSCDIDTIMTIAKKHNLKVIGDTAQAPGTFNDSRITGTLADVGGFSLNRHKHIQTGEGGICVTNDKKIYEKLQLIRNHAEAVVGDKGHKDLTNMIGYNFRMGEIEAAIGIEQLKKMNSFVSSRQKSAELLTEQIEGIPFIQTPKIFKNCTHGYYMYPMILDTKNMGISRSIIKKALEAEGVQGLAEGYINIHMYPMYQQKIAYGSNGFPWNSDICKRNISYEKGICPIAENLHDNTYLAFENCDWDLTEKDIELMGISFKKVFSNLDSLKDI